ncbi:membrane-spanning 4-domains subfamily A member 4D [Synchiropus splendidus]|uniref:membrane-spanning 4-domains subfamily A member 4D n=1 Tax=Synchiropus splendidus TaxID=270530 RepID=UPI00237E67A6|nr:membrane-spanning 4-domains subfamily A member 4D [Synchiropus splendidus]XP_053721815.1 membrane-spanning 4-domains subfamily A member 4D [Synchiropus splendidus]
MPAELYSVRGPEDAAQGTTVGGRKPLHRFIKGQPKVMGIVVMILGATFLMVSIAIVDHYSFNLWSVIAPWLIHGVLFVLSGILFVLTEHNPTKKTVTISLALSIVSVLGGFWTIITLLPDVMHKAMFRHYGWYGNRTTTEEMWAARAEKMSITVEAIVLFYSLVGVIIFIIMSTLAGTALRSSKSQAIIVMSSAPGDPAAQG